MNSCARLSFWICREMWSILIHLIKHANFQVSRQTSLYFTETPRSRAYLAWLNIRRHEIHYDLKSFYSSSLSEATIRSAPKLKSRSDFSSVLKQFSLQRKLHSIRFIIQLWSLLRIRYVSYTISKLNYKFKLNLLITDLFAYWPGCKGNSEKKHVLLDLNMVVSLL